MANANPNLNITITADGKQAVAETKATAAAIGGLASAAEQTASAMAGGTAATAQTAAAAREAGEAHRAMGTAAQQGASQTQNAMAGSAAATAQTTAAARDASEAHRAMSTAAQQAATATAQAATAARDGSAAHRATSTAAQQSATSTQQLATASQTAAQAQDRLTQSARTAQGQLHQNGVSAAQTAAALRGVPAQFTDIITSLQGGQNPLTVLMQQGGQLKDMFGGIGPAAKALGGYVLGLVNPFTVSAAALGALAVAAYQGSQEANAFTKSLILTGNAAGTTTNQLIDMAANVAAASGASKGAAAEAVNLLAGSGQVAADVLQQAAQAAVAFHKAGGGAVEATVAQFAALGKDPVSASIKLNETTNYLTASVYNQIKALADQGKTSEAAKVAQVAYADAVIERSAALKENLGLLEKGWNGVAGAAAGAWNAMKEVGRDNSLEEKIATTTRNIEFYKRTLAKRGHTADYLAETKRRLEQAQEDLRMLNRSTQAEQDRADAQDKANEKNKAAIELDKLKEKYLSKEVQLKRELDKANTLLDKNDSTPKERQTLLGDIKKRYAENRDFDESQTVKAQRDIVSALEQELSLREKLKIAGHDTDSKAKALLDAKNKLAADELALSRKQIAEALPQRKLTEPQADTLRASAQSAYDLQLRSNVLSVAAIQTKADMVKWQQRVGDGLNREVTLSKQQLAYMQAAGIESKSVLSDYDLAAKLAEQRAKSEKDIAEAQATYDNLRQDGADDADLAAAKQRLDELKVGYANVADQLIKTAALEKAVAQYREQSLTPALANLSLREAELGIASALGTLSGQQVEQAAFALDLERNHVAVAEQRYRLEKARKALQGEPVTPERQQKLADIDGDLALLDKKEAAANRLSAIKAKANSAEMQQMKALLGGSESQQQAFDRLVKTVGDDLVGAFGQVGGAVKGVIDTLNTLSKTQDSIAYRWGESLKAASAEADPTKRAALEAAANKQAARDSAQASTQSYAAMAGAAKGFFAENSRGYQALAAAEKIMHVASLGMTIARMLAGVSATATTTTASIAGSTAATTAATVGYETVAVTAVGSAAEQVTAQTAVNTAIGTGAVATQGLGDPYTAFARMAAMAALVAGLGIAISGGSSSGPNVAKERQDAAGTGTVFGDDKAKSESLAKSLDLIEKHTDLALPYYGAMVNSLHNLENSFGGLSNQLIRTGTIKSLTDGVQTGFQTSGLGNILSKVGDVLGGTLKSLGLGFMAPMANLFSKLFGSTTSITDKGLISNAAQSVGQIKQIGYNASGYTDTETKNKFLGITTSTDNNTQLTRLSGDVTWQLGQVVAGLAATVSTVGDALGLGGQALVDKINGVVVDFGRISFDGLTGEQIQKELEDVFSAMGDSIAKQALPGFEALAKAGEGYLETLSRVAVSYQFTNQLAARMGKTDVQAFGAAGVAGIKNRQALVDQFGGVDNLSSEFNAYYKDFYSEAEQTAARTQSVTDAFKAMNIAVPTSREAFKELVNGLDLTSQKGRETFASLMGLAPAFASITDTALSAVDKSRAVADKNSLFTKFGGANLSKDSAKALVGGALQDYETATGIKLRPSEESLAGWRELVRNIDAATPAGKKAIAAIADVSDSVLTMYSADSGEIADFLKGVDTSLAALTRSDTANKLAEITRNAEDLIAQLKKLGDESDASKAKVAALAEAQRAALRRQFATGIDNQLATFGLSSTAKSVYDLNKAYADNRQQVLDLAQSYTAGSQAQKDYLDTQLAAVDKLDGLQRDKLRNDFGSSISDQTAMMGLSASAKSVYDLNKAYADNRQQVLALAQTYEAGSQAQQDYIDAQMAAVDKLDGLQRDKLRGDFAKGLADQTATIGMSPTAKSLYDLDQALAENQRTILALSKTYEDGSDAQREYIAGQNAAAKALHDKQVRELQKGLTKPTEAAYAQLGQSDYAKQISTLDQQLTELADSYRDAGMAGEAYAEAMRKTTAVTQAAKDKLAEDYDKSIQSGLDGFNLSSFQQSAKVLTETYADNLSKAIAYGRSISAATELWGKQMQALLTKTVTGFDAPSTGKALYDAVFNAENAADAGKRFSEAFADSFKGAMLTMVTDQVGRMIFDQILTPMTNAALQQATMIGTGGTVAGSNMAVGGSSAGAAVATGGSIAGSKMAEAVGEVKKYLAAMATILKDPDIQALLKDAQASFKDIGSATYTAMGGWGGAGAGFKPKDDTKDDKPKESIAEYLKGLRRTLEDTRAPDSYAKSLLSIQRGYVDGIDKIKDYTATTAEEAEARKLLTDTQALQIKQLNDENAKTNAAYFKGQQRGLEDLATPNAYAKSLLDINRSLADGREALKGMHLSADELAQAEANLTTNRDKQIAQLGSKFDQEIGDQLAKLDLSSLAQQFRDLDKSFADNQASALALGKSVDEVTRAYRGQVNQLALTAYRNLLSAQGQSGSGAQLDVEMSRNVYGKSYAGAASALGMSGDVLETVLASKGLSLESGAVQYWDKLSDAQRTAVAIAVQAKADYLTAVKGQFNAQLDLVKNLSRDVETLRNFSQGLGDDIAQLRIDAGDLNQGQWLSQQISAGFAEAASLYQRGATVDEQVAQATKLRELIKQRYQVETTAEKAKLEAAYQFGDYLKSLKVSDKSNGTVSQRMAESQQQLLDAAKLAAGTGDAADKARAKLTGLADTYLGLARDRYGSGTGYDAALGQVQDIIGPLAEMGTLDEQQLAQQTAIAKSAKQAIAELDGMQRATDYLRSVTGSQLDLATTKLGTLNQTLVGLGADMTTAIGGLSLDLRNILAAIQKPSATNTASTASVGSSFSNTSSVNGVRQGSDPLRDSILLAQAKAGDMAGAFAQAASYGYTTADLARVAGVSSADVTAVAKSLGIPGFDVGTNNVPADMLALIHQDERIVPAADNRDLMAALRERNALGNQLGALTSLMAELLKELRTLRTDQRTGDLANLDATLDAAQQVAEAVDKAINRQSYQLARAMEARVRA